MKIIAFYLPQFHAIPENDRWWGEGFTEWTNVKAARPLFPGHRQPRAPLGGDYYNLLDDSVKLRQVELAKQYGIYGFCYYHYWFGGKLLLEKPMEQMLANPEIDLPFCVSWANEPWTGAWAGKKQTLIPQSYGDRTEWEKHFEYLLPFFRDERYIKTEGCPLFVIYRPAVISCLGEMLDCWDELARRSGFPGMAFAYQSRWDSSAPGREENRKKFRYAIEYQPSFGFEDLHSGQHRLLRAAKNRVSLIMERTLGVSLNNLSHGQLTGNREDYGRVWEAILSAGPEDEKSVPGAFVQWDNTPRYGENGRVFTGSSPERFERYLRRQLRRAEEVYGSEFLFLNAWNEWAEGNYLEADTDYGYGWLEAVKNAQEK